MSSEIKGVVIAIEEKIKAIEIERVELMTKIADDN